MSILLGMLIPCWEREGEAGRYLLHSQEVELSKMSFTLGQTLGALLRPCCCQRLIVELSRQLSCSILTDNSYLPLLFVLF